MRVLVTSEGKDLESRISARFEDCTYCIFVETIATLDEAVPAKDIADPATDGMDIVLEAIKRGVEVVITGSIGDEANEALLNAGVRVIPNLNGTVEKHLKSLIEHEYDDVQFASA